MFINLKVGVSRINLVSFFLLSFIVCIVLYIKTSITAYLLVSDYGISQHDSGKVAGRIGLYCALCVVPSEFLFGALMDITGRKIPVVVGMFITGAALILMTQFDTVYPTLVLLSCTVSVSILPAYISPFLLDYVTTASLGAASAWNSLVALAGSATATSGVIKL